MVDSISITAGRPFVVNAGGICYGLNTYAEGKGRKRLT
jgi:hypothetical protein